MTLDLDMETRRSLVDELRKYIPVGEQKRVAYAVAKALGKKQEAGESRFSRLLNKHEDVIEQLLGPELAEKVLGAICFELKLDMTQLVRAARKAADQRPRPAPDRHPAWQALGESTPWVDKVPGLRDGTETLRHASSAHGQRVVWLVGPAGSGKSARLWRAQQAKIGRLLVDQIPDEAEPDAIWLVDEPVDPAAWIAGAARCKARLIIATRAARQRRAEQSQLELSAWTRTEAETFLGQLGDAPKTGDTALAAVDLEHIADKLAAMSGGWTPLDLGHLIRLFVDEPALLELDANDRELHIRSAMHRMVRRVDLSPVQEKLWNERGRQACALMAATAVRDSGIRRPIGPIGAAAAREALAELTGVTLGGKGGESLHNLLERARRESRKSSNDGKSGKGGRGNQDVGDRKNGKGNQVDEIPPRQVLQKLETWARSPSSDDLIELLVELGAWRRDEGGLLAPIDAELALTFAAERLDDDWMWRRLLDTLADPEWASARITWAPCLGHVEARIDELLATDAASHVGAIELAVALVALARELPRPDQVERAVCSAVRLLECQMLTRIGLSPIPTLEVVVRHASRRHLRSLPWVTTAMTRKDLEKHCTENTRRIVGTADHLAEEDGSEWLRESLAPGQSEWVTYAVLMPWQTLPALQEPEGLERLRFERFDREAVLMDHAADGHTWAREVAIGDVENIQQTLALVSSRGLLRALERWPAPCKSERHLQALAIVLNGLSYGNEVTRSRLQTKIVCAIVDFVSRHPNHPLPNFQWFRSHEASWRAALDQAAAVHQLQAWFETEQQELADAVATHSQRASRLKVTQSQLPPAITESIGRLLRLGEVLHRHGVAGPLRGLLEKAEHDPRVEQTSAGWELAVGAADALLRLHDAASLRELREPYGSARYHAVSRVLSRESHDEETVLWIADHFGDRYDEVLKSIVGRPERREIAKRWALDARSSFLRHVAARWLLSYPAAGDCEHVRWLFTELPVKHSADYVDLALAHPDEALGVAAIALLRRAFEEVGDDADLVSVAQRFAVAWEENGDGSFAMIGLQQYLDRVNASRHTSSPDSIQRLIELTQRHLASSSDEQVWILANGVCSSLAGAARRLRLASLATWVRNPLGDRIDDPAASPRIEAVRAAITSGFFHPWEDNTDLDPTLLQAIADTADPSRAQRAHFLLLERESPSEALLLAEWAAISDAALVDREPAPARFYAVQDQLRRRAPHVLARALADRLLALAPELRRFGVSQIRQVAMLDPEQAARLSPLFE